MSAPAAFQGDYCDLRFVKGRKVCQIVIEIPIEAGASFVAAFGAPNPAVTIPVALARLGGVVENETPVALLKEDAIALPKNKGGKLCQKAAILCNEGAFRTFLAERDPELKKHFKMLDTSMAIDELRATCGVQSRSEIDGNEEAAHKFKNLEREYKAWMMAG